MLGVRIEGPVRDIPVAADGSVAPDTGGMSVALDEATNLPIHRLPRSLGGDGRDPVFRIFSNAFAPALIARPDPYPHACVEPRGRCLLDQYESHLLATRSFWSNVHD
jgi:hypothetical protein